MMARFRQAVASLTAHTYALWSAATGREDRDAFASHLFLVCALATAAHLVLLVHQLSAWVLLNDVPFLAIAARAGIDQRWRRSMPQRLFPGAAQLTADLAAVEALFDLGMIVFARGTGHRVDVRVADMVDSLAWTLAVYALLFPPSRRRHRSELSERVHRLLRRWAQAPAGA